MMSSVGVPMVAFCENRLWCGTIQTSGLARKLILIGADAVERAVDFASVF
jgi:hypothetical protein